MVQHSTGSLLRLSGAAFSKLVWVLSEELLGAAAAVLQPGWSRGGEEEAVCWKICLGYFLP